VYINLCECTGVVGRISGRPWITENRSDGDKPPMSARPAEEHYARSGGDGE